MANTETSVSNLKINRLTQTQLENASSLSNTEAYWVDPEFTGGKVLATDSNGDIVESAIAPTNIGTVKTVNNTSPDSNGNVSLTIPTVDQTYGSSSSNAQSGVAVASALTDYQLILQPFNLIASASSISLSENTVNQIILTGNVAFTLPSISEQGGRKLRQILVRLYMSTVYTIDVGTTRFFNKTAPDLSATGTYDLFYEYDGYNGYWVCGVLPMGAVS